MYLCVILLVPVCTMSVFVCVMPSQSASKSHVICVKPTVNVTPCCIKYIARCFWYFKA